MPDNNQIMLTAEGEEITVVAPETNHENKNGGGGAGISNLLDCQTSCGTTSL